MADMTREEYETTMAAIFGPDALKGDVTGRIDGDDWTVVNAIGEPAGEGVSIRYCRSEDGLAEVVKVWGGGHRLWMDDAGYFRASEDGNQLTHQLGWRATREAGR